ncbi:hypothetical protein MLD38_015118 [Melastoma candidum]|uniref:Uncharacterized protein n=1 Tax=Melastoma candidum TaxID=119954 RepID=A0ACB9RGF3_9MYRT|nr:hypothetical protein MLD38_015118 [Melastoma candidum]
MGNGDRVEVVSSLSCSKLLAGFPTAMPSSGGLPADPSMSPAVSSRSASRSSSAPFSGLVICVTGLSKEARKQVMEATGRLGGKYSPDLHPQCTHLVVQSFGGRKFEHALKHGSKNGLFIVTLGWFVESVKRNVRLNELSYSVKDLQNDVNGMDELSRIASSVTVAENSCLPSGIYNQKKPEISGGGNKILSGRAIYVDSDISSDVRIKVVQTAIKEGATLANKWFAGCSVTDVVSEGMAARRYLGHCNNLITPLWLLKTAKENEAQRLVHLSVDLARQLGTLLDKCQIDDSDEAMKENGNIVRDLQSYSSKLSHEERQRIVEFAKNGVRNRRGRKMQTCQTPMRPITPSTLLDSICWSVSDPTSTACIYTDSRSSDDGRPSVFFDAKTDSKESEASFANLTCPLTESEKSELVFKQHFLTILFPVDRFSEMGPSSRTFFGQKGFTCLNVLDHIYKFYQENMSAAEIEVAIHTDSRHANRLRSLYASDESANHGFEEFKRVDFLGSRRSFEMLKRVVGDNNGNVYELLIRA